MCAILGGEGAAGFSELLLYNMILDWKLFSESFCLSLFALFGHRSIVESVQLSVLRREFELLLIKFKLI